MTKHETSNKNSLYHIKEAIEFILSQTNGLAEDDFYRDEVLKER